MSLSSEPTTLVELFYRSVERFGSRSLFQVKSENDWTSVTYTQVCQEVDALRSGLVHLGISPGDKVAIVSRNRMEWAVVAYATYSLGAVLVPMFESMASAEWTFILRDAEARVVFAPAGPVGRALQELRPALPSLIAVILFDGPDGLTSYASTQRLGAAQPIPQANVSPDAVAALLYTSGTTGDPKGVVLSHQNICSNVRDGFAEAFGLGPEDLSLSILPWAHSFGHTGELHVLVSHGACIAIGDRPDLLWADLAEVRPTLFYGVPRLYRRLQALAISQQLSGAAVRQLFGGRLRYAFSGGAALPAEVLEFMDGTGLSVYEGYGLTETSPGVALNQPGARRLGSVGRPIRDVGILIDRGVTNDPLIGEVVVYGPNVMLGYHNRPHETLQALTADGGLRSGDLGYVDEDGFLFLTGRIKEQYKLENGKYIVPGPLEDRMRASPLIANVLLYGDNRPYNVALIVPNLEAVTGAMGQSASGTSTLGELSGEDRLSTLIQDEITRLSTSLKEYEKIRTFKLIFEDFAQANGLLTATMKNRRQKIIERWASVLASLYPATSAQPSHPAPPGESHAQVPSV